MPAEQQELALGLFARGNDAFAHFDYIDQVGGSERRWRPWVPWLVVGGGAVVLRDRCR